MVVSRRQLIGLASGALGSGYGRIARGAEDVYESVYNSIFVSREGPIIAFRQMEGRAPQSEIDLERPSFQVLPYTRFLFAAAIPRPMPGRVLGIGLGAGAFNRLFNLAFPSAVLTTVEVDPMMLRLAVELTGFRTTPLNRVVIDDGRRFLDHSEERWDWIVMDPYVRNSQIPPHLTTQEFFESVRRRLRDDGAFVVNIVAPNPLFYSLVKTLRLVFPNSLEFAVPGTGNRIFLAAASANPDLASRTRSDRIDMPEGVTAVLAANGVDFAAIRHSVIAVAPPAGTPVLTDDFAPSEYLGSVWGKQ